jgi:hypothetical protein
MKAETQINVDYLFETSDTINVDSFIYEECKFAVVDTVLTLNYTTYRANTPITSTIVFVKNDD